MSAVVEVPLSKGGVTLICSDDLPKLQGLTVYRHPHGYAIAYKSLGSRKHRINIPLHHLIIGKPGHGLCCDHINGDRLDNRRENLRLVTPRQNAANIERRDGMGVDQYGGHWSAFVIVNGKRKLLGKFENPETAHAAQVEAISAGASEPPARMQRGRPNISGFPGVFWVPLRWKATIGTGKYRQYLGLFKTRGEAIAVRRAAEEREFGEFASRRVQS